MTGNSAPSSSWSSRHNSEPADVRESQSATTSAGRSRRATTTASAPVDASTAGRDIRSSRVTTKLRKSASSSTTNTGDETAS